MMHTEDNRGSRRHSARGAKRRLVSLMTAASLCLACFATGQSALGAEITDYAQETQTAAAVSEATTSSDTSAEVSVSSSTTEITILGSEDTTDTGTSYDTTSDTTDTGSSEGSDAGSTSADTSLDGTSAESAIQDTTSQDTTSSDSASDEGTSAEGSTDSTSDVLSLDETDTGTSETSEGSDAGSTSADTSLDETGTDSADQDAESEDAGTDSTDTDSESSSESSEDSEDDDETDESDTEDELTEDVEEDEESDEEEEAEVETLSILSTEVSGITVSLEAEDAFEEGWSLSAWDAGASSYQVLIDAALPEDTEETTTSEEESESSDASAASETAGAETSDDGDTEDAEDSASSSSASDGDSDASDEVAENTVTTVTTTTVTSYTAEIIAAISLDLTDADGALTELLTEADLTFSGDTLQAGESTRTTETYTSSGSSDTSSVSGDSDASNSSGTYGTSDDGDGDSASSAESSASSDSSSASSTDSSSASDSDEGAVTVTVTTKTTEEVCLYVLSSDGTSIQSTIDLEDDSVTLTTQDLTPIYTFARVTKTVVTTTTEEGEINEDKETVTFEAEADGVRVIVTAEAGVFPDNTALSVSLLEENGDLADAERALEEGDIEFDDFLAIDITFYDSDTGEEIEPDTTESLVSVTIELDEELLPESADADSIAVQHIEETESGTSVTSVADAADETDGSVDLAEDGQVSAEFEVESFSTFTVTWSLSGTETIITVVTVDSECTVVGDGSETITFTVDSTGSGSIETMDEVADEITISGYYFTGNAYVGSYNEDSSKYSYDSDASSIVSIQLTSSDLDSNSGSESDENDTTTYTLQYTTDGNNWTDLEEGNYILMIYASGITNAKIYGEDYFDEEYSAGYFDIDFYRDYKKTSYELSNDDAFEKMNLNDCGLSCLCVTNNKKDENVYVDWKNAVNINNVYYDMREYIWVEDAKSGGFFYSYTTATKDYFDIYVGGSRINYGLTNGRVVREFHFYESGFVGCDDYEVEFNGVLCLADMDRTEGFSFEEDKVKGIWVSGSDGKQITNVEEVVKTLSDGETITTYLGNSDHTNGDESTANEHSIWVEVSTGDSCSFELSYWGVGSYGAGINYKGNTVTYSVVDLDGIDEETYVHPVSASLSYTYYCATNGKYSPSTDTDELVEQGIISETDAEMYKFEGWFVKNDDFKNENGNYYYNEILIETGKGLDLDRESVEAWTEAGYTQIDASVMVSENITIYAAFRKIAERYPIYLDVVNGNGGIEGGVTDKEDSETDSESGDTSNSGNESDSDGESSGDSSGVSSDGDSESNTSSSASKARSKVSAASNADTDNGSDDDSDSTTVETGDKYDTSNACKSAVFEEGTKATISYSPYEGYLLSYIIVEALTQVTNEDTTTDYYVWTNSTAEKVGTYDSADDLNEVLSQLIIESVETAYHITVVYEAPEITKSVSYIDSDGNTIKADAEGLIFDNGDELTYTITFDNPTTLDRTITLVDEIPAGLSLSSDTSNISITRGNDDAELTATLTVTSSTSSDSSGTSSETSDFDGSGSTSGGDSDSTSSSGNSDSSSGTSDSNNTGSGDGDSDSETSSDGSNSSDSDSSDGTTLTWTLTDVPSTLETDDGGNFILDTDDSNDNSDDDSEGTVYTITYTCTVNESAIASSVEADATTGQPGSGAELINTVTATYAAYTYTSTSTDTDSENSNSTDGTTNGTTDSSSDKSTTTTTTSSEESDVELKDSCTVYVLGDPLKTVKNSSSSSSNSSGSTDSSDDSSSGSGGTTSTSVEAYPGDTLTYTITFKNPVTSSSSTDGTADSNSESSTDATATKTFTVTDTLPERVRYQSGSTTVKVDGTEVDSTNFEPTQKSSTSGYGGTLTWELPLTAAKTVVITFEVIISEGVGYGIELINTANVSVDYASKNASAYTTIGLVSVPTGVDLGAAPYLLMVMVGLAAAGALGTIHHRRRKWY